MKITIGGVNLPTKHRAALSASEAANSDIPEAYYKKHRALIMSRANPYPTFPFLMFVLRLRVVAKHNLLSSIKVLTRRCWTGPVHYVMDDVVSTGALCGE